ncbi:hypothetical protein F5B20DRAFT_580545 [Whalleya microplaca]|nr:hypothetical protein F5B20DRAFT_580545 [Whalleya microplaca]
MEPPHADVANNVYFHPPRADGQHNMYSYPSRADGQNNGHVQQDLAQLPVYYPAHDGYFQGSPAEPQFHGATTQYPALQDASHTPDQTEVSEPLEAAKPRVKVACDLCNRSHQPCDAAKPRCDRCARMDKDCTFDRPLKKRGPRAGYVRPFADPVLGAVIQSNPELEQYIIQVLLNGKFPGTQLTPLEYLHVEANRSGLVNAYKGSELYQLVSADPSQVITGANGGAPGNASQSPDMALPETSDGTGALTHGETEALFPAEATPRPQKRKRGANTCDPEE